MAKSKKVWVTSRGRLSLPKLLYRRFVRMAVCARLVPYRSSPGSWPAFVHWVTSWPQVAYFSLMSKRHIWWQYSWVCSTYYPSLSWFASQSKWLQVIQQTWQPVWKGGLVYKQILQSVSWYLIKNSTPSIAIYATRMFLRTPSTVSSAIGARLSSIIIAPGLVMILASITMSIF